MTEMLGTLGLVAGGLLFAAAMAWAKLGRTPILGVLSSRAKAKTQQVENASRLLVIAAGAGAVVAVLAVADLMFR